MLDVENEKSSGLVAHKYWRSVAMEFAATTDAENDPSVLGTCGTNASSSLDNNKASPCSSGVGNGGALFSLSAPSASDISGTDDDGGGGVGRIGRMMGGCDAAVGIVLAGGFVDDVSDCGAKARPYTVSSKYAGMRICSDRVRPPDCSRA